MVADLDAQRAVVRRLRALAVDFINCDIRPLIFDGTSAARVGPLPIPPTLIRMLTHETFVLARLEEELRSGRREFNDEWLSDV